LWPWREVAQAIAKSASLMSPVSVSLKITAAATSSSTPRVFK
jgi:hypothetical protein